MVHKYKIGAQIVVHCDINDGYDAITKLGWTGVIVGTREHDYKDDFSSSYGPEYVVNIEDPDDDETRTGWHIGENNLRLLKGETSTMSDIKKDLKLAKLSDDDRLLYEEGIIELDGTPTALGLELANAKLFEAKKPAVLSDVQAAVAKRTSDK